eukprot:CAMPEP_0201508796 /NCGR_PEP_ID=MMETSP0161_2-20130828/2039_1 /ASSEMBLY_ACC=CAM_ASM_000251 /TAXON_ID=180227 /ORGANISM="Neoparamoeba aestuarina, Strain SoJaBio B1-5/56/2" /LENGTH=697 /DNA_ID=CAMNT_0047903561 /DNA_START=164 /DNA_END=2257 /DNA_ORIENTATION=-
MESTNPSFQRHTSLKEPPTRPKNSGLFRQGSQRSASRHAASQKDASPSSPSSSPTASAASEDGKQLFFEKGAGEEEGEEEFSITRSKRWTVLKLEPWLLIRPDPESMDLNKPSASVTPAQSTISMPVLQPKQPETKKKQKRGGEEEGVFGAPFRDIRPGGGLLIPLIVVQCVEYMRNNCLTLQGIFRISAVKNLIDQTKTQFGKSKWVPLEQTVKDKHVIPCILKLFFRETPEPLFPFSVWEHLLETYRETQPGSESAISAYITILRSITAVNLAIIVYFFQFLNDLKRNAEKNLMNPQNLGIIFGPGLLRPPISDPLMLLEGWDGKIIEQLIDNYDEIFSNLGSVVIEGSWDNGDYRETFGGYIATALRPRFNIVFIRELGTKVILKCDLVFASSPGTCGAQAFTVGVEKNATVQEFLGLVSKRAKDIVGGDKLHAFCIQKGSLDPKILSFSENLLSVIKKPDQSIEVRVLDKKAAAKPENLVMGTRREEKKEGKESPVVPKLGKGSGFGGNFRKERRRASLRGDEGGEDEEDQRKMLLSGARHKGPGKSEKEGGGDGSVIRPARPHREQPVSPRSSHCPHNPPSPQFNTRSPSPPPEEESQEIEFLIFGDEEERKISVSRYATVYDFVAAVGEATGYPGWVFIVHSKETYFYNPSSSDLMVNLLSEEEEGSLILQGYTMVVRYLGLSGRTEEIEE